MLQISVPTLCLAFFGSLWLSVALSGSMPPYRSRLRPGAARTAPLAKVVTLWLSGSLARWRPRSCLKRPGLFRLACLLNVGDLPALFLDTQPVFVLHYVISGRVVDNFSCVTKCNLGAPVMGMPSRPCARVDSAGAAR